MSQPGQCPKCGVALPPDAPGGLCPGCVLELGWANGSGAASALDPSPTTAGSASPAPPPHDLARHFPQLEVLELLGQGGMGAVYKARQTALDRLVAVKVLPLEVGRHADFAERFAREARALARLSHPNIVGIHDVGQSGGHYYIIMEYVDGMNLRRLMQDGALTSAQALAIVPQICEALQYAHDEGIVHRDIKPENILVDKKGRIKIADFGLAKLLGSATNVSQLTGTYQVMGTFHYMAPEQFEKPLEVDHRADIYSLGVVFYELLTHELPIGRFALPSHKVEVDVRLDEVVLRALEKDPPRRYQHASDIKTDVETITRSAAAKPPVAQASPTYSPVVVASLAEAGRVLSVPIALDNLWGGFAEGHGVLRFDGEELLLEYEVRENFFQVLRLGSYVAPLPLSDVADLTFKPGWWGHTLKLQAARFQAVAQLAGSEKGQIKFSIKSEDRIVAERLAGAVALRLAGESWESAVAKAEVLLQSPVIAQDAWVADDANPANRHTGRPIAAAVIGVVFWMAALLLLLLAMRSTNQNSPQYHSQFWSGIGLLIAGGGCLAAGLVGLMQSRRSRPSPAKLDPAAAALEKSRTQLATPARGLWIAALVDLVCLALLLLGVCYLAWEFGPPPGMTWAFGIAFFGLRLSCAPLQLFSAARMRRLENRRLAILGTVIALIPGSPGWLLGMPMGVWTLGVLRSHTVAEIFAGYTMPIPGKIRATISLSVLAASGLALVLVGWTYATLPSEATAASHAGKWITHETAGPRLSNEFATRVELRPAQTQAIDDILQASYERYRESETANTYLESFVASPRTMLTERGAAVRTTGENLSIRLKVRPFATRRAMLESSTWRQIDLVLDQRQRGLAHQCDLFSDLFLAGRSRVRMGLENSYEPNKRVGTGNSALNYRWTIERQTWNSGSITTIGGESLPRNIQPLWDRAIQQPNKGTYQ